MHRRITETLGRKETVQRAAKGSCSMSERVPEHGHIIRARMLQQSWAWLEVINDCPKNDNSRSARFKLSRGFALRITLRIAGNIGGVAPEVKDTVTVMSPVSSTPIEQMPVQAWLFSSVFL